MRPSCARVRDARTVRKTGKLERVSRGHCPSELLVCRPSLDRWVYGRCDLERARVWRYRKSSRWRCRSKCYAARLIRPIPSDQLEPFPSSKIAGPVLFGDPAILPPKIGKTCSAVELTHNFLACDANRNCGSSCHRATP